MAKKKSPAPKAAAKAPAGSGMTVISVKMTTGFRDWLARLADHDRSTIVQVMEKGSIAYAKQIGFLEPAPKRTEGR
jgi:hypothetical protein